MEHDEEGLIFADKGGYFRTEIDDRWLSREVYTSWQVNKDAVLAINCWRLIG